MKTITGSFLALAVALGGAAVQAQSPPPAAAAIDSPPIDALDFLTQSLCLGRDGEPTDLLPIDPACTTRRLQRSDDPARYRKHDWPDVLGDPAVPRGYMASDSVLLRAGGRTLVVQTFDFGTQGRVFGKFDAGQGDGGQVALAVGDWLSFVLTEDGGAGVQWFIGEGCRTAPETDRGFLSWLLFRDPVSSGRWQDRVARLNIVPTMTSCPPSFGDAYTRYRRDTVEFPFLLAGRLDDLDNVKGHRQALDVVVSEHYGGRDIATADHLERFFFARGLGMVRWELWSNRRVSRDPKPVPLAAAMARSARCPALTGDSAATYGAPGRDWIRFDCRTWTVIFPQGRSLAGPQERPWSVDDYGWRALEAFTNQTVDKEKGGPRGPPLP